MNSYNDSARSEYEAIERIVDSLISEQKTDVTSNYVMQQVDIILQSVLFYSAIEDGMYFDGESSFLYSVVRHYDVLEKLNRNLGATLKKPLTWEGLVFLPAPGKRNMTEALRTEAGKAVQVLREILQREDLRRIKEKLLEIAEIFSRIDLDQKGAQIAESEMDASKREVELLFNEN